MRDKGARGRIDHGDHSGSCRGETGEKRHSDQPRLLTSPAGPVHNTEGPGEAPHSPYRQEGRPA
jgi:hypothetical protein